MGCSSSKDTSQQQRQRWPVEILNPNGSQGQEGAQEQVQTRGQEQVTGDPSIELSATKQIDLDEKINMLMIKSPTNDVMDGQLEGKESERHHSNNNVTGKYEDAGEKSESKLHGKNIFSWFSFNRSKNTTSRDKNLTSEVAVPTSSRCAKDTFDEREVNGNMKGAENDDDFSLVSILKTPPSNITSRNNDEIVSVSYTHLTLPTILLV